MYDDDGASQHRRSPRAAGAELVVEILSPGQRPGEKLPFYARRHIDEYVEIDLTRRTVRLLRNVDGTWLPADRCEVAVVTADEVIALLPG